MANRVAVAMEHVQHRPLGSLRGLGEVVAVVGVAGRGQEPEPSPATLLREGDDVRQRGLRDDREVDTLAGVLRGALELVEECYARGTGALLEREQRRLAARWA